MRSSTVSASSAASSEQVAKLEALRELGVDQFALYLQHDSKDGTLAAYGDNVIPAINKPDVAKL